jgi:hypothetical protein
LAVRRVETNAILQMPAFRAFPDHQQFRVEDLAHESSGRAATTRQSAASRQRRCGCACDHRRSSGHGGWLAMAAWSSRAGTSPPVPRCSGPGGSERVAEHAWHGLRALRSRAYVAWRAAVGPTHAHGMLRQRPGRCRVEPPAAAGAASGSRSGNERADAAAAERTRQGPNKPVRRGVRS